MTTDVYFAEIGEAAILFRYQDNLNYYAVELNGKEDKIQLIKRTHGNKQTLSSYDIEL